MALQMPCKHASEDAFLVLHIAGPSAMEALVRKRKEDRTHRARVCVISV